MRFERTTMAAVLVAVSILASVTEAAPVVTARLDAGTKVIMIEEPGSEMVLAAVAVPAGSAWETAATRGVTHLLEHLLFDGSERFSREEIDRWVDDNGIFLNAFTRKEVTVYFLLCRVPLLERSVEILSQMLLHPLFEPSELEKERSVVLEEMIHSLDMPGEELSRTADRYLYRGTALTEPVIGYPATIRTVSRERIIDYHGEHYRPERMTVLLIGGFEPGRAAMWIEDYFAPVGAPPGEDASGRSVPGLSPRWSNGITSRSVEGASERLELLIEMPPVGDDLFPAALLLEHALGSAGSPLARAMEEAGLQRPETSLEVHREFCAMRIGVETAGEGHLDPGAVLDAVRETGRWRPGDEELSRTITSMVSAEMFDRERYHFYMMLYGERVANGGEAYFEAVDRSGDTGPGEVEDLLERYLEKPRYNGFLSTGERSGPVMPGVADVCTATAGPGTRCAAVTRRSSRTAAVCLLLPGRACGEEGWSVSALHAVIAGAKGHALEERLESIGARAAWSDNPYIPMDDYMIDPAYSFVRLEAPAAAMDSAASALGRFLLGLEIAEEDIAAARGALAGESAARWGQAGISLDAEIYAALFPAHPYGRSLFPAPGTAAGIGDLESAVGILRGEEGIVAAVVSPLECAAALARLSSIFGREDAGTAGACPPLPPPPPSWGRIEKEWDKESACVAAAWRVDGPSPRRAAALGIACEVLGKRMQLGIRETLGLAYSTGCGVSHSKGVSVAVARVMTGGGKIEEASKALDEAVEGLASSPPRTGEIEAARSRLLGRMARRDLSCAGEAFSTALDLYLRDGEPLELLTAGATEAEVLSAAEELEAAGALYLRMAPSEAGEEREGKKSMPPGVMRR